MSKRHAAMYLTRKLKLGHTDQLDALARRAGDLAQLRGMTVKRVGEAYTSQTCPSCGTETSHTAENTSAGVDLKGIAT